MRARSRMLASLAAICLAVAAQAGTRALAAQPPSLEVPVELWDRPRTGRTVIAVPAVRQALDALGTRADARLAIRHGPGQESAAQAEELKAWLIAHAVEPGRIALLTDASTRHALKLEILADGKP